jgi:hypothetical protein
VTFIAKNIVKNVTKGESPAHVVAPGPNPPGRWVNDCFLSLADCPVKNIMFTKAEFDGEWRLAAYGLACSQLLVLPCAALLLCPTNQRCPAPLIGSQAGLSCLLPAVDRVLELATTMQERNVSQKCQDEAVENLASCASDDSMAVKIGCCSQDCSTGIKKVCIFLSACCFLPLGTAFSVSTHAETAVG